MDNMKFAVVVADDSSEGESKSALKVFNIAPVSRTFSVTIVDFMKIQFPSPVLVPAACRKFILNNLATKAEYKFYSRSGRQENSSSSNGVELTLPIYDEAYIKLELTEEQADEKDYKRLVFELERRLDEMDPYEQIDFFTYPTWSSYAEFQSLPEWKYFERWINRDNYIKNIGHSSNFYILESNLDLSEHSSTYDVKRWITCLNHGIFNNTDEHYFNKFAIITNSPTKNYDELFYKSIALDSIMESKQEQNNNNNPTQLQSKKIKSDLGLYFSCLIRGWIIYNPHLYKTRGANHSAQIKCVINLDKLTLTIYRYKKQNYNELYLFNGSIPHIRVVVNDKSFNKPYISVSFSCDLIYKGITIPANSRF